jgi:hypothetical protein
VGNLPRRDSADRASGSLLGLLNEIIGRYAGAPHMFGACARYRNMGCSPPTGPMSKRTGG